jgi:hypothetical protein
MSIRRSCLRAVLVGLLFGWIAVIAGCGSGTHATTADNSTSQFVPSVSQAEAALRAVIESWKKDEPPGMIPGTSPAIHITDTFRKPDEKLVDYRILGEVPSERKRCIAVELRFKPERAERTRFLVVGIDPLWVFRQEDAENLAHWEHNMDEPKAAQETKAEKPNVTVPVAQSEEKRNEAERAPSAVRPASEASP